jgi:hypothetical protein
MSLRLSLLPPIDAPARGHFPHARAAERLSQSYGCERWTHCARFAELLGLTGQSPRASSREAVSMGLYSAGAKNQVPACLVGRSAGIGRSTDLGMWCELAVWEKCAMIAQVGHGAGVRLVWRGMPTWRLSFIDRGVKKVGPWFRRSSSGIYSCLLAREPSMASCFPLSWRRSHATV